MARKDKDCPYKRTCYDTCEDCEFHFQFEYMRKKIERLKAKNKKLKDRIEEIWTGEEKA